MGLSSRTDLTVVFAGAGASTAVDPDQYPTTAQFFGRLPAEIIRDPFFAGVVQFLGEVRQSESKPQLDVELVLAHLEELRGFMRLVRHQGVSSYFLRSGRLASAVDKNQNYQNILNAADASEPRLSELIGRINRQVYRFYGQLPKESALHRTWIPFLDGVMSMNTGAVEIFTTNYDLIIESALRVLKAKHTRQILTGRIDGAEMRVLDTRMWLQRDDEPAHGMLTKLHGSVEWSRDEEDAEGDTIYVSDPHFKGSDGRHVILYPGFKGVPDREPFATFHAYFENVLTVASRIIFIGFAFRDEHINRLLKRLTRSDCQITALNPAERLDVPFDLERYRHIPLHFDGRGIEETLNYLRNAQPVGGHVGV